MEIMNIFFLKCFLSITLDNIKFSRNNSSITKNKFKLVFHYDKFLVFI